MCACMVTESTQTRPVFVLRWRRCPPETTITVSSEQRSPDFDEFADGKLIRRLIGNWILADRAWQCTLMWNVSHR